MTELARQYPQYRLEQHKFIHPRSEVILYGAELVGIIIGKGNGIGAFFQFNVNNGVFIGVPAESIPEIYGLRRFAIDGNLHIAFYQICVVWMYIITAILFLHHWRRLIVGVEDGQLVSASFGGVHG